MSFGDGLTSRQIVELVLGNHPSFKDASRALANRPPDEDAARDLVDAFGAGRAPAWLVAHLLGCLRARSQYEVARSILMRRAGLGSESYAGVAMVRIAGADARDDLVSLMENGSHQRVREGALSGLCELADASVLPAVMECVREKRVRKSASDAFIAALATRDGP